MNPEPFTYAHFMQAMTSFKDDMFMYYIDEAVRIYCRLKGTHVGPRPASSKDYTPEYADAFEVANVAIFTVAKKMHSYDSAKGEFKKYLDAALKNTVNDILKADGRGDFFDQTSKKKNKEDEPEKHSRVSVDRFWGSADNNSEPDNVIADREERVRKHKDDAFETMIRFIDSLSDIKRAAIYSSAFGQILRPDLENYGRNYADVLAKMYDTTASYIRKLATDGKKAAIAEAHRLGFNERSMGEISMGYMQVRNTGPDINDQVLRAVEQMDSYQQFLILRHLAANME